MATKEIPKIVKVWKSLKSEKSKMKKAFVSLKKDAESFLVDKYGDVNEIKEKLEKSRENSQEKANFCEIAELTLAEEVASKKLKKYIQIFVDTFGSEPKLLNSIDEDDDIFDYDDDDDDDEKLENKE
jgi:hypothetical protein